MSASGLKKITVLNDPVEAELMRGLLEAQGIDVMLSKEAVGTVYGLTVGSVSEVEVFVPQKQYAEAKKIVDEYFRGDVENNEP